MVDYLPAMYMYEFFMQSKKPGQIAAYDTLYYPFDDGTWIFTIISLVAMFSALLVMQNIWSMLTGNKNPKDYIFEGKKYHKKRKSTDIDRFHTFQTCSCQLS